MARINNRFSYLDGFRSGALDQSLTSDHWSRIGDSFSPFAAERAAMQVAVAPSAVEAPVSLTLSASKYPGVM